MDSHNRTDAGDALDEKRAHNEAAERPVSAVAEGGDLKPDKQPDFARGIRQGPEAEVTVQGRFSEGVEQTPDTPEKLVERRFSEGVEQTPEKPEKIVERRFSEGVERSPTST